MVEVDVPDLPRGAEPGAQVIVPRLSISGISKQFGGVQALTDVSFDIAPGEIHALVGENGAGKSTLVKIVTGVIQADRGKLVLNGRPVSFSTATEARESGVAAVYQDAQLFPGLSVAENIFMEMFPATKFVAIDWARVYREARRLIESLGVDLDPRSPVARLSIAERQFVAMARALATNSQLLILDEPTATITPAEADRLFVVMRRLREMGSSVLFISHRIEELQGLVDSVTVLRDGRHITTQPAAELGHVAIVSAMVGRTFESLYDRQHSAIHAGDERLRVESLSLTGKFEGVSFAVRAGEVVTLAGLVGSGRTEIAEAIFGITPPTSGSVYVDGKAVRVADNRRMLALGVAYVPEDRDGKGLITQSTIRANMVLSVLDRLSRFGFVPAAKERDLTLRQARSLQVKMTGPEQLVSALSGGNRQKVVLAKWLATSPSVLILDEPTHGIDIATKVQVHQLVAELAARGLAILQISSDLPEVLATSDRILVMSAGRLAASFDRAEATQEKIMLAATSFTRRVRS
jgi:rhamnose transport system ATP-binding protein